MTVARNRLWLAAQIAFVVSALWYAATSLSAQWDNVRSQLSELDLAWWPLLLSGLLVLMAYTVLIQTWRTMLRACGAYLSVSDASRIWFVSNLGKYLPGKVWQIAAMAAMARRAGASATAATGSSLVVNVANVMSGCLIVLATGAGALRLASGSQTRAAIVLTIGLAGGLIAIPLLLPSLARMATRITGRSFVLPRIPTRAIAMAVAGTVAAWLLYGIAFQLLTRAVLGAATGATTAYIAVYTISYLVGYLALLAPGGIGVREAMLVAGLSTLGLASEADGWLLALFSRLWLTVLEVIPGVVLLALTRAHRRSPDF